MEEITEFEENEKLFVKRSEMRGSTHRLPRVTQKPMFKKTKTMPIHADKHNEPDGDKRLSQRDQKIVKRISQIFNIKTGKSEEETENDKTEVSFTSNNQKEDQDTQNFQDFDLLDQNDENKKILEFKRKHVLPKFLALLRKNSEADQHEIEEEHEYEFATELMLNIERSKYPRNFYLEVREMNVFERTRSYNDSYPYLELRKKILFIKRFISFICYKIIKHPVFEFITLLIILSNSIFLALDDPLVDEPSQIAETADFIFLILYTIEMVLKIFGMGLVFSHNTYLRDAWNVLDFIIILSAYMPYMFSQKTINLSILRSFRILRPLRAISSVKRLRSLLGGLFSALPLLKDTLIILLFFYIIFAIAFLNLFQGVMKKRCFGATTGKVNLIDGTPQLCHDSYVCPPAYICGKMLDNPNWGITNFDSFPFSILMVFQTVTLEGWTDIMISLEKTFSPWVVLAFIAMVFIGAFFIINLTLAVIKVKFSESMKIYKNTKVITNKGETKTYPLARLRKLGILKERVSVESNDKRNSMGKGKVAAIDIINNIFRRKSSRSNLNMLRAAARESMNEKMNNFSQESPRYSRKFKGVITLNGGEAGFNSNMTGNSDGFDSFVPRLDSLQVSSSITNIDPKRFNIPRYIDSIKATKDNNSKVHFQAKVNSNKTSPVKKSCEKKVKTENSENGSKTEFSFTEMANVIVYDENEAFLKEIEDNDEILEEGPKINTFMSPNIFQLKSKGWKETSLENCIEEDQMKTRERRTNSVRDVKKKTLVQIINQEQTDRTDKDSELENISSFYPTSEDEHIERHKPLEESHEPRENKIGNNRRRLKTALLEEIQNDADFIYFDKQIASRSEIKEIQRGDDVKKSPRFEHSLSRQMSPIKFLRKIINSGENTPKSQEIFRRFSRKITRQTLRQNTVESIRKKKQRPTKEETRKVDLGIDDDDEIWAEEDPEGEILKNTLNPKFLRVRVISQLQHPPVNIEDVLPSRFLKELEEKQRKENELLNKAKFTIRYHLMKSNVWKMSNNQQIKRKSLFAREKRKNQKNKFLLKSKTLSFEKGFPFRSDDEASPSPKIRTKKSSILESHRYSGFFTGLKKSKMIRNQSRACMERIMCLKNNIPDSPFPRDLSLREPETKKPLKSKKKVDEGIKDLKSMNVEEAKIRFIGTEPKEEQKEEPIHVIRQREMETNEYTLLRKKNLEKVGRELWVFWSGEDIFDLSKVRSLRQHFIILSKFHKMTSALNYSKKDYLIWLKGLSGKLKLFVKHLNDLIDSSYFETLIMTCVVFNTVLMSIENLIDDKDLLQKFNLTFTLIFTIEMSMKIISLGILGYFKDKMNIFDCFIVILSLVEIFYSEGNSSLGAFKAVRILRTFRVLRVTRLVRSLQYMRIIMNVMSSTFEGFMYIFLLMFLFIYIYSLLGMQTFGGKFNFSDGSRYNFDTFEDSFFTVFQILTLENWQSVMFNCFRSSQNMFISAIYLISWIFIGNYVLLNLFLAVLLEGFSEEIDLDNEKEVILDDETVEKQLEEEQMKIKLSLAQGPSEEENKRKNADQSSNRYLRIFINISQNAKNCSRLSKNNISSTSIPTTSSRIHSFQNIDKYMKHLHDEIGTEDKTSKEFVYFENIACERAFFILKKTSLLRKCCYRLVKHTFFDNFILFLILFSTIKLVVDTYAEGESDQQVSVNFDIFFISAFSLEALLKATSLGFFMEKNTYLRDNWNQLDFFIVCISLIDISFQGVDLGALKVLRLLRILRPLRFVSHNKNMRLVVTALLESVSGIANVILVILLIWIMFGILGMSLMSDRMGYCSGPADFYGISRDKCLSPNKWTTYDVNFDNIFSSIITLFILSSLEGWPDIMYNFIDGGDDYEGPQKGRNKYLAYFFIIFIFVGGLFLMNLFIGVILMNFNKAESREKNKYITEDQLRWIEMMRLIATEDPDYRSYRPPEHPLRRRLFKFVKSYGFEMFIIVCIILNIVLIGMTYEGSTSDYENTLNKLNYFFTAIFILEAIIKIFALGPRGYFYTNWNKFDMFVVVASVVDILFDLLITDSGSGGTLVTVGPQIIKIFRVLRVSRLFKLIKSFQGLNNLIQTAIYSLPSLFNVVSLLFLLFFVYSVLGVFLFKDIKTGKILNDHVSFNNFSSAFMVLFRCVTGEDWYVIMFDTMREFPNCEYGKNCGHPYYCIYFLTYILICQYVMLNLFVLVILRQFEENYINPDNPLQNYKYDVSKFKEVWVNFTRDEDGMKINEKSLVEFYITLQKPLGLGYEEDKETLKDKEAREDLKVRLKKEAAKNIMRLNIYSDMNGNLFFNDLLFFFMKRASIMKIFKDVQPEGLSMIKKEEEKLLEKIENRKKRFYNKNKRKLAISSASGESMIKRNEPLNPMVTMLFLSMSFRSWFRYKEVYWDKIISVHEKNNQFLSGIRVNTFSTLSDSDSETLSEKDENNKELVVENESQPTKLPTDQDKLIIPKKEIKSGVIHEEENEDEAEELTVRSRNTKSYRGRATEGDEKLDFEENEASGRLMPFKDRAKILSHTDIYERAEQNPIIIGLRKKSVNSQTDRDRDDIEPLGGLKNTFREDGGKSPLLSGNQSRSSRKSESTPRIINYNISNNLIINNNFFLAPDFVEPIHSKTLKINSKQSFSLIASSVEGVDEMEEQNQKEA